MLLKIIVIAVIIIFLAFWMSLSSSKRPEIICDKCGNKMRRHNYDYDTNEDIYVCDKCKNIKRIKPE